MINNITNVDSSLQMTVAKTAPSFVSIPMPPIIGFKTPELKQKANIRVKKIRRGDNIIIPDVIDDDYVDTVEENVVSENNYKDNFFCQGMEKTVKTKYLKNCYLIDFIQSPIQRRGLGTEALKTLAEKAMFDSRAEGRIVTYSAPVIKEASPAMFFYKLGFRFTSPESNEFMEECLAKNMPDIPVQTGMMYLPKSRLYKLLRYGELF